MDGFHTGQAPASLEQAADWLHAWNQQGEQQARDAAAQRKAEYDARMREIWGQDPALLEPMAPRGEPLPLERMLAERASPWNNPDAKRVQIGNATHISAPLPGSHGYGSMLAMGPGGGTSAIPQWGGLTAEERAKGQARADAYGPAGDHQTRFTPDTPEDAYARKANALAYQRRREQQRLDAGILPEAIRRQNFTESQMIRANQRRGRLAGLPDEAAALIGMQQFQDQQQGMNRMPLLNKLRGLVGDDVWGMPGHAGLVGEMLGRPQAGVAQIGADVEMQKSADDLEAAKAAAEQERLGREAAARYGAAAALGQNPNLMDPDSVLENILTGGLRAPEDAGSPLRFDVGEPGSETPQPETPQQRATNRAASRSQQAAFWNVAPNDKMAIKALLEAYPLEAFQRPENLTALRASAGDKAIREAIREAARTPQMMPKLKALAELLGDENELRALAIGERHAGNEWMPDAFIRFAEDRHRPGTLGRKVSSYPRSLFTPMLISEFQALQDWLGQ